MSAVQVSSILTRLEIEDEEVTISLMQNILNVQLGLMLCSIGGDLSTQYSFDRKRA